MKSFNELCHCEEEQSDDEAILEDCFAPIGARNDINCLKLFLKTPVKRSEKHNIAFCGTL